LRYEIREKVIAFLQQEYPQSLPPLAATPAMTAAEPPASDVDTAAVARSR
jgi:hypothetical protein